MENLPLKGVYEKVVALRKSETASKNQLATEVVNVCETYENAVTSINTIWETNNSEIAALVKERTNALLIGEESAPKMVQIKNAGDNIFRELKNTKPLESSVATFTNLNLESSEETLQKLMDFDRDTVEFIKMAKHLVKVFKEVNTSAENKQEHILEGNISSASTNVSQLPSFSVNNGLITSSPIKPNMD